MPYGVTDQGWVSKPLGVCRAELDTGFKGILGASAGTEPDQTIPLRSLAGQQITMLTDGFAEMWDLGQALYSSFDPKQNGGSSQDAVAAITASVRLGKQFSTANVVFTGDPGTVLQPKRAVTVQGTKARFESVAPAVTLASVPAWATATPYAIGDRVTANGKVYQCTDDGTSLGSGTGPSGSDYATPISDGTVTWRFLGAGTAAAAAQMQAVAAGQIAGLAYTLTEIATPVNGWKGVANPTDVAVGRLRETDADFRLRRDAELAAVGATTADAILADVLRVNENSTDPDHEPPTSVLVFYNDSDETDANGLPPHSVEVLALGGTAQDIAQAVFDSVGAGIEFYGNQTSTVVDDAGNSQTVKWSRPTEIPIYIVGTVWYDPLKIPASVGDPAAYVEGMAASAILTSVQGFKISKNVRSMPLRAAVFYGRAEVDALLAPVVPASELASALVGVVDVTTMNIGVAPSPAFSADINIGLREVATFDSARISIAAAPEVP